MSRFRTSVVIAGYVLLAIVGLTGKLRVEPPKPISVVAPTEAQIKEQVTREWKQRQLYKALNKSTAAARVVYVHVGRQRCADLSVLTGRAAYEFGISARLLAAVVFVESGCNPNARSGRDSVGLTQVNPRVWGHRDQLTNPEFNIRFGAKILAGYIHRYGLVEGLHHYNGLGDPSDSYARKVLAAGAIAWPS